MLSPAEFESKNFTALNMLFYFTLASKILEMKQGMHGKKIDPLRVNSFESNGSEFWKNEALICSE
jgi:hypothetical protein